MAKAGFKFNVFADRDAKRNAATGPSELIRRLGARTTTTNHPPAPVVAMLGEIIVHGGDIRRPLGLAHTSPEAALVAVADSWKNSNLLIGAKRRVAGLRLRATDGQWTHGDGPEVSGPMASLVMAMAGPRALSLTSRARDSRRWPIGLEPSRSVSGTCLASVERRATSEAPHHAHCRPGLIDRADFVVNQPQRKCNVANSVIGDIS